MKISTLCAALLLFFISNPIQAQKNTDLTQYVDPIIGSAKHGHVFVGANVPFGAVQLGPVNVESGWDWCSGYNYISNNIVGFAHTHLSGTGIGDLGDILVMPTTGKLLLKRGKNADDEEGYISKFSHKNEVAKAGYYSVLLDKYNIRAELTATNRVGFHKYLFPKNAENPHLVLNLNDGTGWDSPTYTYLKQIDATTIVGQRNSTGWANDQRLFFVMKLSQPIKSFALYDSTATEQGNYAKGKRIIGIVNFDAIANDVLKVKVALSPVSVENAMLNLKAELPGWNFEATVKNANANWQKELEKVRIDASTTTKKVFYTALYHTMIAPSTFNDVNKDYFGSDKKIHRKGDFNNYTTFSLWDTYRAANPLYTLIHQDRVNDIVKTMLHIYKEQGKLPVWHLMANETNTMVGYHAVPVIVDAYLKGFRGYDVNLAYQAIKQSAMQKTDGIEYIQKLKYIPADKVGESVAKALEYAIDDYCIAMMAKSLKKTDDYHYFSKRAQLYRDYFDKDVQFMRGKMSNGTWRSPYSPFASKHREDDYTEGNGWQYTWLVPQDVEGLIKLFGGDKPFVNKLDSLFTVPQELGTDSSPDISGLIGNYAQGNEPGHHIPYLYAYAGMPWKTADLIRTIDKDFYTSKPDGLCGNEDVGQMSAWYVFSALGFYPVNPANGNYVFGSPLTNGAILTFENGKKFKLKVVGNSVQNKYIQKMVLNGKPYPKSYISHKAIVAGGDLTIYMGSEPSKTWGVKLADRPKSER